MPFIIAQMSSNAATTLLLEEFQKKQLLSFIEEAGGLEEANFKLICDKNWQLFGKPGSATRRSFQKELSNLRKRNPRNYLGLLSEFNIKPSEQAIERAETGSLIVVICCCCCCCRNCLRLYRLLSSFAFIVCLHRFRRQRLLYDGRQQRRLLGVPVFGGPDARNVGDVSVGAKQVKLGQEVLDQEAATIVLQAAPTEHSRFRDVQQ